MALKNSWQQQRQHRRQQVVQRRQSVRIMLQEAQKQRQTQASQLHNDLNLFREMLISDATIRRQELEQYCTELHDQTQAFLKDVRDRRQAQAQLVAEQLSEFVQQLQQQTAEFLMITEAERSSMAQQLAYDLKAFRMALDETSKSLRQEIQADIKILQAQTQTLLNQAQQQQIKTRVQLTRTLTIFVEKLRSDVQNYLSDVALERQEQAVALSQALRQSRVERKAEVAVLFDRFAEFRSNIRQYRADLTQLVWGDDTSSVVPDSTIAKSLPTAQKPKTRIATVESRPEVAIPSKIPGKPKLVAEPTSEEKIYQYIDDMQGARLSEIESALSMNRFQAVEGLRSLIQKGKITQRDRVYLISDNVLAK